MLRSFCFENFNFCLQNIQENIYAKCSISFCSFITILHIEKKSLSKSMICLYGLLSISQFCTFSFNVLNEMQCKLLGVIRKILTLMLEAMWLRIAILFKSVLRYINVLSRNCYDSIAHICLSPYTFG